MKKSPESLYERAREYLSNSLFDEAFKALQEAERLLNFLDITLLQKIQESVSEVFYARGMQYKEKEIYKLAFADFRSSLEISSRSTLNRMLQRDTNYEMGKICQLLAMQKIRRRPEKANELFGKAMCYFDAVLNGLSSITESELQLKQSIYGEKASILFFQAENFGKQKRHGLAIKSYLSLLELYSGFSEISPEGSCNGMIRKITKLCIRQIHLLNSKEKRTTQLASESYRKIVVLLKKFRLTNTKEYVSILAAVDPKDTALLKEALRECCKMLKSDKNNLYLYAVRAVIFSKLKEYKLAEKDFRKVRSFYSPGSALTSEEICYWRAIAQYECGKTDQKNGPNRFREAIVSFDNILSSIEEQSKPGTETFRSLKSRNQFYFKVFRLRNMAVSAYVASHFTEGVRKKIQSTLESHLVTEGVLDQLVNGVNSPLIVGLDLIIEWLRKQNIDDGTKVREKTVKAVNKVIKRHPELFGGDDYAIPWSQLELMKVINSGSYAEVYEGRWNGKKVAIKRFLKKPDHAECFKASRFRHPAVITFYGVALRNCPRLRIVECRKQDLPDIQEEVKKNPKDLFVIAKITGKNSYHFVAVNKEGKLICRKIGKSDKIFKTQLLAGKRSFLYSFVLGKELNAIKDSKYVLEDAMLNELGYKSKERDYFGVMELMEESLAEFLNKEAFIKYPWINKLEILRKITDGLRYFHRKNLLHLDIKNHNILCASNWTKIKLADFGTVRNFNSYISNSYQKEVVQKQLHGTHVYSAPEILSADKFYPYSKATDIYAFGLVMWELLHGKLSYTSLRAKLKEDDTMCMTEIAIAALVVEHDIRPMISPLLSSISQRIIRRCLDRNPKLRPTNEEIRESISEDAEARDGNIRQILNIMSRKISDTDKISALQKEMFPKTIHLNLSSNKLSNKHLRLVLRALKNSAKPITLDLSNCRIDSSEMKLIAAIPNLQALSLDGAHGFNELDLKLISQALLKKRSFQWLSLRCCGIGDSAIEKAIIPALKNSVEWLGRIDLCGNHAITDGGLSKLLHEYTIDNRLRAKILIDELTEVAKVNTKFQAKRRENFTTWLRSFSNNWPALLRKLKEVKISSRSQKNGFFFNNMSDTLQDLRYYIDPEDYTMLSSVQEVLQKKVKPSSEEEESGEEEEYVI